MGEAGYSKLKGQRGTDAQLGTKDLARGVVCSTGTSAADDVAGGVEGREGRGGRRARDWLEIESTRARQRRGGRVLDNTRRSDGRWVHSCRLQCAEVERAEKDAVDGDRFNCHIITKISFSPWPCGRTRRALSSGSNAGKLYNPP
jgi:hypothetical protein